MTASTSFLQGSINRNMTKIIVMWFFLVAGLLRADFATQTDWSGGPSVAGPVTHWGETFESSVDISWLSIPGQVSLSSIALATPIEHLVEGSFEDARAVCAADVDGDGDIDILGAAYIDGVAWWENGAWTEHTVDNSFWANFIYTADLDGDDDVDVLCAGYNPETDEENIVWWENEDGSGTSWSEHTVAVDSAGYMSVHVADVDGDGDVDVLSAGFVSWPRSLRDGVVWWENEDGSGTNWIKHIVDDVIGFGGSVYAADIDGDADLDVVAVLLTCIFPFEGELSWWENEDGSGTSWTKHYVTYLWSPMRCYPADVDGDADIDVLVYREGGLDWWENEDGLGTSWGSHSISGPLSVRSLYATDMDGDQDVDVLCASYYGNSIVWFENIDGSGISWVEHQVTSTFYGASSVYAADIDDDTDLDIVGTADADAEVTWWEVTEFKPAGELVSSIFDLECDPEWHMITWAWDAPEGTSIKFQVRASDDYTNMGEWSQEMNYPGSLQGILTDRDSYFQYKNILTSSNPACSPILEHVTISWTPLGIASNESSVNTFVLEPTAPNPIVGSATISFVIPENSHVRLKVFDVSGRLVDTLVDENLQAGRHSVVFDAHDLTSGIYYYRLEAGTFVQTRRCVLLK